MRFQTRKVGIKNLKKYRQKFEQLIKANKKDR